jgi:Ala-tRNA(Pro) deacylase
MDIFRFLEERHIGFERADHPAVFTVEEADRLVPPLPGAKTKNLFVYDERAKKHFLVVIPSDRSADLKALAPRLGMRKLSFGSPERLKKLLGIEPGAVSILAAACDPAGEVQVVIDRRIAEADALQCHPLVNTSTLVIRREGIRKFLEAAGHAPRVIDVPCRA